MNRHAYRDPAGLARLLQRVAPDVVDLHEEPFSLATRQWLSAVQPSTPLVVYTAQNIDKRFPFPFSSYERRALTRASGLYPCSHQAAAVARGKGFAGPIEVIPLGYEAEFFKPGSQTLDDPELIFGLFGRLIPEKGIRDAVHVVERVNRTREARLILGGEGPEAAAALDLAARLGLSGRVEVTPWGSPQVVADLLQTAHVLLVPSKSTATWVEQFGRVIVEAQASGAVVAGYASGSIPEAAGAAGCIAPEGRIDLLSEKVLELISTPGTWANRRDKGLELAKDRSWDRVAARQIDLYQRVLAGSPSVASFRDGRLRRRMARQEFGAPATTTAGDRPFAFPPLRNGGWFPRLFGQAIDLAQTAWAFVSPSK